MKPHSCTRCRYALDAAAIAREQARCSLCHWKVTGEVPERPRKESERGMVVTSLEQTGEAA